MSTATTSTRPNTDPADVRAGEAHHAPWWREVDRLPLLIGLVGAALSLAVAVIHVQDQGGFWGDKTPEYVAVGYYIVEAVGAVGAGFLVRQKLFGWFLSLGVAAGPIIGYVLSRGPGLPDYSDDIGNWTETLGVVSLIVEGALLVLAVAVLVRAFRARRA